jgi:hypothetical protein
MAMCSFVPPFREAKFCGVPSCAFDKLGCAAGEKRLRNTVLVGDTGILSNTAVLVGTCRHQMRRPV